MYLNSVWQQDLEDTNKTKIKCACMFFEAQGVKRTAMGSKERPALRARCNFPLQQLQQSLPI